MKILMVIALCFFSLIANATPVSGEIFYKKKNGDLVRRSVVLEVPSMGKGEVVLSGKNFEWRSTDFWSMKVKGQTVFTVTFKTEFMGMKSLVALRGTYLKGKNEIIYSGDFFKKKGHAWVEGDISDFPYGGGFSFSYQRQ